MEPPSTRRGRVWLEMKALGAGLVTTVLVTGLMLISLDLLDLLDDSPTTTRIILVISVLVSVIVMMQFRKNRGVG